MELTIIYFCCLDAAVEINDILRGEGDDSLLEGIGAALEEAGLGVARLGLAGIVHRVDVKNLDVVELLDSLLDFDFVGALVNDKTIAVIGGLKLNALVTLNAGELGLSRSLGEAGHFFADERFDYDIHLLKILKRCLNNLYFVAKTRVISEIEPSERTTLEALTMS